MLILAHLLLEAVLLRDVVERVLTVKLPLTGRYMTAVLSPTEPPLKSSPLEPLLFDGTLLLGLLVVVNEVDNDDEEDLWLKLVDCPPWTGLGLVGTESGS